MAFTTPASDLYGAPGSSNVTAVLGPTNTGKTHLAIERMLGHDSGLIGLPLRLLAREVYDKIAARVGAGDVALITGEEKIKPKNARYWVSTVEAMPRDIDVDFVAIDEIQLAADPERGHVFTDRLFHARGRQETLLLGAETMRTALTNLLPGVNFISRPRLSKLSYAGPKKISRLPRRSAIVAFSANDVYQIAELIRRQRGGAAVVLGALSPRTRNAQVEMFQSGEVDFLVATDAVGMGLNLDVHHVAFAGSRKFDGVAHRELTPAEVAQIAGRAGRHIKDGTFGVTGDVAPFEQDLIDRIENHDFDQVGALQWRPRSLDFASVPRLLASLKLAPEKPFLVKAREADDVQALEVLANVPDIAAKVSGPANVQRLWEVCQVPDYRKIGVGEHTDLVKQLFKFINSEDGRIPDDWLHAQIDQHDRVDGDIDTIATRIAHIRTWTFVANRVDWLRDPVYWQGRTREIEDKLSDALHQGLTKRFVDRRTSTLMKRLRDQDELYVEIDDQGQLHVEDHFVGKLSGFQFTPDDETTGVNGRATRAAASKVLVKELTMRSEQLISAECDAFELSETGEIMWQGSAVGRLTKGDHILKPQAQLLADDTLTGPPREETATKLQTVVDGIIRERLAPLVGLYGAEDVSGLARGVAFQLAENLGILQREPVANDIRQLDQDARGQLRKYGVRFGAFNIYFPILLKPAATEITRLLWLIFHDKLEDVASWELPRAGLTSAPRDQAVDADFYRAAGFHACGGRVVRVDMLERLADQIRALVSWRAPKEAVASPAEAEKAEAKEPVETAKAAKSAPDDGEGSAPEATPHADAESRADGTADKVAADQKSTAEKAETQAGAGDNASGEAGVAKTAAKPAAKARPKKSARKPAEKPEGATGDGGFTIVPDMMSIMGCSAEELGDVLQALGFRAETKAVAAQKDEGAKTAAPQGEMSEAAGKAENIDKAAGEATADEAAVVEETVVEVNAVEVSAAEATSVEVSAVEVGDNDAAPAAQETPSGEAAEEGAPAEPEVVVIWRPARRPGRHRAGGRDQSAHRGKRQQSHNGKRAGNGAHGKPHKGGGKHAGKTGRPHHGKQQHSRPEKEMDPDSPFAKLQALKDQIENKAGS